MKQVKKETIYTLTREELIKTLTHALCAPQGEYKIESITKHESDQYNRDHWEVFMGVKLIVTETK